jgi:hypothetical protein
MLTVEDRLNTLMTAALDTIIMAERPARPLPAAVQDWVKGAISASAL